MSELVFSAKDETDLLNILRYIVRDKPQATVRFVDQLEQQCAFLARFPESGMTREDLAPRLRLFTFRGYGIYFRNLGDRVRIERVLSPGLDILRQSFD